MPLHDPTVRGPHDPATSTPPRSPRSIRRTSSVDTTRPDGVAGRLLVVGRARDLLTTAGAGAVVLDEAEVVADLEARSHRLAGLRVVPEVGGLDTLTGATVGPGFRSRVDAAVPAWCAGTPLCLLLDDLPGAVLVAGYALLHADAVPAHRGGDEYLDARADLCAGWASDGAMMRLIRAHGRTPTPLGPEAPPLARDDDPLAWHALAPLGPLGMRRLRRIDVTAPEHDGRPYALDVLFRDSHFDDDGLETVVHEYSVAATVDAATRTILAIEARPDVLPWQECPAAVASARRLVGRPLSGLRTHVRQTFVGTSTCTHLNDVLRGLADVDGLVDRLGAAGR